MMIYKNLHKFNSKSAINLSFVLIKRTKMQMTINFNKLFNYQDSTSNTPSTTSIQSSYHIDESSIISNPSNKINIHYKFNEAFFFDNSQDHEENINILEDLSSIGRSSQDDLERESQIGHVFGRKQQPKLGKNTNKPIHNKQSKLQHTFYLNEKDTTKSPGERLYYESKIKNERKQRQLQRIKMQMEEEEKKQTTFKPALNEKSKKILQLAESPFRKLQNMKKTAKNQQSKKQSLSQLKSTAQKKQQQQLRNCTFKPCILKTPKSLTSTLTNRSPSQPSTTIFDTLYNQHRTKIQRQRKLQQQQQNERKVKSGMLGNKEQLEEFFNRNKQYMQEKKHREELLKLVAEQYDLTSGRKLFQPKINGGGGSSSGYQQFLNSSKTPKSARPSVNSSKSSSNNIKSHIRSNSSTLIKSKEHQQVKNKKQAMIINDDNHKGKFKAKAYQLSKFTTEQVPQTYDEHDQQQHDDDNVEDDHGYEHHHNGQQLRYAPQAGIFNKTQLVDELFKSNQQQQADEQQQLADEQQHSNHDYEQQTHQPKDYYGEEHVVVEHYQSSEDEIEEQHEYCQHGQVKEIGQGEDNRIQSQQLTPQRKPSEDYHSTINRSTFLESIVKNPIYSHKYHDLFALQSTQKPYEKLDHTQLEQKQKLFKPLFLAKDSEEQEVEEKLPNKSWQEIFTASTKIDKSKTIAPSESGFTQTSRVSQIKPNSSMPYEESPRKKAINIASLLKAKKKQKQ